jgi:membrane protein DedA with SNARE-associated domain
VALAAIISVSSSLGYLLPAIIGLESMGIPSPGETALVAAAVLASQGQLSIWLVLLIGIGSAIIGDNVGYWLGRRLGRGVVTAPGPLHRRRLQVVESGERFFHRHGPKSVFLARWIVLIRFAAAWLAGINRMRVAEFFLWNALGAITWGLAYGLAGYFGGKAAAGVLASVGIAGVVVITVVLLLGWAVRRVRERRRLAEEASPPPAPATADEAGGPSGDQPDPSWGRSSKEQELMQ